MSSVQARGSFVGSDRSGAMLESPMTPDTEALRLAKQMLSLDWDDPQFPLTRDQMCGVAEAYIAAREPVEMDSIKDWACPACHGSIIRRINFCEHCGKGLKWV
jgi:hypothetical protein